MRRLKWIGSLAIVGSVVLGHPPASQGRAALGGAAGIEEAHATLRRVVTGVVCLPDGSPAAGAVVVTSAGGQAVTGAGGSFALELDLPLDAESLDVTAFVDEAKGAGSLVASARVVPAALSTSTSVGTLALTRTFACAPRWLPTFGSDPGTNGDVNAFAVFDDGHGPALYAGGEFTNAGNGSAGRIARWDGSRWSALDGSPNGHVYCLTVFDDGAGPALYVGGTFTLAGGLPASRIARWGGSSWSALGSGMSGINTPVVTSLTVFDDGNGPALYAGGSFSIVGGLTTSSIARWDGSSWAPVGGGVSDRVFALAVFDDGSGLALYAGGTFVSAGGSSASCVAKWNGTSWAPLGGGTNLSVVALAIFDDGSGPALYAGGVFVTAGGVPANRIARWDGSSWSPLGSGVSNEGPVAPRVNALAVHDDGSGPALYAAGTFRREGGVEADNIARWDGSSWSPLGGGLGNGVQALLAHDAGSGLELYAGTLGGRRVARWNGAMWTTLGLGIDTSVFALASWDDGEGPALYVGGDFTLSPAGDSNLTKWGCKAKSTVRIR